MSDIELRVKEIKEKLKVFDGVNFNEAKHEYTYNGVKARISMTGLVSKYKNYFNQELQAKRYAAKHKLDYNDVLAEWRFKAVRSTTKGTAIHKYLEDRFTTGNIYIPRFENLAKYDVTKEHWKTLTEQADSLRKTISSHLIVLGSEVKVFDPDTGVGGAIDLLVYHPGLDEIFIIDYKSNGKIEKQNLYNKFMKDPLGHLPDTNFVHYSLQTNGYQHIIEKRTGLKLRNNHFLAHINEDNDGYVLIPTADLLSEASLIIDSFNG